MRWAGTRRPTCRCSATARSLPTQLRKAWIDIPEVVSAATVTGTADAMLHVLARDMRHLEEALERIRSAADVERSESIVVLTNIIDRMRADERLREEETAAMSACAKKSG